MLNLILSVTLLIPQLQSDPQPFYVDKVVVYGRYDTSYILRRENAILPPDELVTQTQIQCFLSELKASGLFKKLRAKTVRNRSNRRTLELTATYKTDVKTLNISDIILEDFHEIDETRFREVLESNGLTSGVPLLKHFYARLEQKINESLRSALSPELREKYQGTAWISIRPDGSRKVKLVVRPTYSGCNKTLETAQ
jgi:hypothetical protein